MPQLEFLTKDYFLDETKMDPLLIELRILHKNAIKRKKEKKTHLDYATDVADMYSKKKNVEFVLLHGSLATKKAGKNSDVDLMIAVNANYNTIKDNVCEKIDDLPVLFDINYLNISKLKDKKKTEDFVKETLIAQESPSFFLDAILKGLVYDSKTKSFTKPARLIPLFGNAYKWMNSFVKSYRSLCQTQ